MVASGSGRAQLDPERHCLRPHGAHSLAPLSLTLFLCLSRSRFLSLSLSLSLSVSLSPPFYLSMSLQNVTMFGRSVRARSFSLSLSLSLSLPPFLPPCLSPFPPLSRTFVSLTGRFAYPTYQLCVLRLIHRCFAGMRHHCFPLFDI